MLKKMMRLYTDRFLTFLFQQPISFVLNLSTYCPQVPQVSRRQAEQVLSSCASQLKKYLTETVKSSSLSLDKHSGTVDSICEVAFNALKQEEAIANENEVSSLSPVSVSNYLYCL